MPKYRKKPVVIEAMYLKPGLTNAQVQEFCPEAFETGRGPEGWERVWAIKTLEGVMSTATGEWIIKGIKGEFYPCKPDIFEMTYERVGESEEQVAARELASKCVHIWSRVAGSVIRCDNCGWEKGN